MRFKRKQREQVLLLRIGYRTILRTVERLHFLTRKPNVKRTVL